MERRLEAALEARDAALLELARTREEFNRIALADRWPDQAARPNTAVAAVVGWAARPIAFPRVRWRFRLLLGRVCGQ